MKKISSKICTNLVNRLLEETQGLVASVEAAAIDGLNGNYVARITSSINKVHSNIQACPSLKIAKDQINSIRAMENHCFIDNLDK